LRAFSGQMLHFIQMHSAKGWDVTRPLPQALKAQVREIDGIMHSWVGRSFAKRTVVKEIHADSSDNAWGAIEIRSGQAIQEFWRHDRHLHINIKELRAAVAVVQSLAAPGDHVHLCVDNSVTFHYLRKGGGRLEHLNLYIKTLWEWCMKHNIRVTPVLVPSALDQADALSRTPVDKGDYTLHQELYNRLMHTMIDWCQPTWDMFASPGNNKLPQYACRWPHVGAKLVDSLHCPLKEVSTCYANPPWTLISAWLHRLKEHPSITCVMITPLWVSAPWWPLLVKLRVPGSPAIRVHPFWWMFQNFLEEDMPPTRWPLLCTILSGRNWREGKFRLRTSEFTWTN
jgi:hypothetical protein